MAVEPLAQEYVEVARSPSPQVFTGECTLTHLPGGDLLASYRFFSRPDHPRWSFNLARSCDGGQNWEPLPALDLCDGLPFVHEGNLHLLAAPLIDGDDLLILSRTSRNAPNQHDSDLVTFHRIKDFRNLALNLHPEM